MAKTKNAKSALPHVQRLLEDEYVQEQIRNAAAALRNAYGRAARKRAQATEDKKLYSSLRHAATSIRNATIALRRPPEPPPKHHARSILIIALAIGATVMITKLAEEQKAALSSNVAPSPHGDAAPATAPSRPESTIEAS
jgi:hypothetical protein